MKKIYLTLFSALSIGTTIAQVFTSSFETWNLSAPYLSKDFEDGSITTGSWTTQAVVGTNATWAYGSVSGKYAKATGYINSVNTATDAWYISPAINLTVSTSPILTFSVATKYSGAPIEVRISTDYTSGAPSTGTWTSLSFTYPATSDYTFYSSGSIDLSAYKNTNVHIAFRYTSTTAAAATWEVDNIIIEEILPKISDWFGSKTSIAKSAVAQVTGVTGYAAQLTNQTAGSVRFTSQPFAIKKDSVYRIRYYVKGQCDLMTGFYTGKKTTPNGFMSSGNYVTTGFYTYVNQSGFWYYTDYIKADTTTNAAELTFWIKNTAATNDVQLDDVSVIAYPTVPQNKTIYEIQYSASAPFDSPEKWQYRITNGIITAIATPKIYSNNTKKMFNGLFLQNGAGPWNGLFVNLPDSALLSGFAIGDSISVSGVVKEDEGCTKLVNVIDITKLASGKSFVPFFTNTSDFASEQFEGVLVHVTDATCNSVPDAYNTWTATDGSAVSAVISDFCYRLTISPIVGSKYEITGCVDYAYHGATLGNKFSINPRMESDVDFSTRLKENMLSSEILFYPNPSFGSLTIVSELQIKTVMLYNVLGEEVLKIAPDTNKVSFDLANLNQGIYLVQVNQENKITTGRISKQ